VNRMRTIGSRKICDTSDSDARVLRNVLAPRVTRAIDNGDSRRILSVDRLTDWMPKPAASPYGRSWSYCTAGPTALGPLLERATGQSVPDFARDNLLTPPGITRVKWQFPGRVHAARGLTRRERFDITPLLMRHSRVAVSSSMSLKSCAAADRLGLQ